MNHIQFDDHAKYTEYGTPQSTNIQTCQCDIDRCQFNGDTGAYCVTTVSTPSGGACSCSYTNDYISYSDVCNIVPEPEYCSVWAENCAQNITLLSWNSLARSKVNGYSIYKDDILFLTVCNQITSLRIEANSSLDNSYINSAKIQYGYDCGFNCLLVQTRSQSCGPDYIPNSSRTNYSVAAIYYVPHTTAIEYSAITQCSMSDPTQYPSASPISTHDPTSNPTMTTISDATAVPTTDPTIFIFSEEPSQDPTMWIDTSVPPTVDPTAESTTDLMTLNSTLESTLVTIHESSESTEVSLMTTEEDGVQCPGLGLAIVYIYAFEFDDVQKTCDICLYPKGKRAERKCEKIESFIAGIVDEFSDCLVNVCDYDCTLGDLTIVATSDVPDLCGCDTFECTLAAGANGKLSGYWILFAIHMFMIIFG